VGFCKATTVCQPNKPANGARAQTLAPRGLIRGRVPRVSRIARHLATQRTKPDMPFSRLATDAISH
jgi:hypothetical protein